MRTEKLRLDQAPPLAIPATFFLLAPASLAAAGLLLIGHGGSLLVSGWVPGTIALVHLGTLGFLGSVMLGALYQMIPVVAGTPVPQVRLAYPTLALLLLGTVAFAGGLLTSAPWAVTVARLALLSALLLFAAPVGLALFRSSSEKETSWGMRLAVLCLILVGSAGLLMAGGHVDGVFPGPRRPWIQAHMGLGLLGWVGGLITAISWQVVPMFYLCRPVPTWGRRAVLGLVAFGALTPPIGLALGAGGTVAAALAAPAAAGAWLVHPVLIWRTIGTRTRKRPDPSLRAWQAGVLVAPLVALVALTAQLSAAPRWDLLLVWLAIWGWAGVIMHGMLTRIVPFLVWYHRWSPLVGKVRVPSMKSLLPTKLAQAGLIVHGLSVLAGVVAILSGWSPLARVTGGLVVATAAILLAELVLTLRPREAAAL